jgi:O-antigen/teichoic acid export membrane protein
MADLATRLLRSSFLRIVNPIVNIAVAFFMIPFIIGHLGDRWYGLWIFVGTMIGYFGFLDLGIATANERYIARALGQHDQREVDRVFNSSLALCAFVSVVSLVLTAIVIAICPYYLRSHPEDVMSFRLVVMLVGIDMAVAFPMRAFFGLLYAHIRYDVVNLIGIVKVAVRTALTVWALGVGHGIVWLASITLVCDLVEDGANLAFVFHRFPETALRLVDVSRKTLRELFGYSVYSFISTIAWQLRFNLDPLVITKFLGLRFVTHYSIGSRIAGYYLNMVGNAISSMKPVFSRLEGRGDVVQLREQYLFTVKLNAILSTLIGGTILIYGKAFMLRWMGANYLDSFHVLVVLTIGMLCNALQAAPSALLYGISKHRPYAIIVVAEGIVNLALSILLVKRYGIVGVALGTTIPMFFTSLFIVPYFANRAIDLPWKRFSSALLGGLVLGGAVHAASWFVVRRWLVPSYGRIAVLVAATGIIYLAINTFALLTKQQRRYFKIPV